MWNTLDEFESSWCFENFGFNQSIKLQESGGSWRLKLTRHANVIGMEVLSVSRPSDPSLNPFRNGSYSAVTPVIEGDGYGAILDEVATFLGLIAIGSTVELPDDE